MGTNIISKTLSRVYRHPTKAKQFADAYAEKMRARGYEVQIVPSVHIWPVYYMVDVLRKR